MPKVILKYEGESHQLQFGLSSTEKSLIEKEIKQKWGLQFNEFTMTYKDSDDDKITVENENDFTVAKESMDESDGNLLVFQAQLNMGVVPKFLTIQMRKNEQEVNDNQVVKESESSSSPLRVSPQKEKIESKNVSHEKKKKKDVKTDKKIEQQEKKRVAAEAKKKAKDEAQLKRKEQAEIKEQLRLSKEIERKAALEKKEAEKREKLEKHKKQKPIKQECLKVEEDLKLNEQKIRELVRSQIFNMLPQIKGHILKKPNMRSNDQKEVDKQFRQNLNYKCSSCNEELDCPFYFNPKNKVYICEECEKVDNSLEGLLKIRNPKHFSQNVYTYAGFVNKSDFAQVAPVNYNDKLKELLIIPIKSDFKAINQLLKKSM